MASGTDFPTRHRGAPWMRLVLAHYGVASGYGAAACAGMGKASPCFGPNDSVSYAQTISFITRAVPDSRNYTPESASV